MTAHVKPPGSDLLAKFEAAKAQCEINDTLLRWIADLKARLGRAKSDFLYVDCNVDHRDLEAEIERLRVCIRLAKERRR